MHYDKKSTMPRGFPEETWLSTDPEVIIAFLIAEHIPYWAMKMHLFAWARYHSIHILPIWVDRLKEAESKTPIKQAPLDQKKIL